MTFREDGKPFLGAYAICFEIIKIYCQDGAKRLALSYVDKGSVGEVHRPIFVAGHELLQNRKIGVVDNAQCNGSGAHKFPGGGSFPRTVSHEVKQLGKDRFRSKERESNRLKCVHAGQMPPIVPIQEREDEAGINERCGPHDAASGVAE
jgi:hypothetical protein